MHSDNKKDQKKNKNILRVIGNIAFYTVLIFLVFITFSIFNAEKQGKQPELFGYKAFVILTGSMSPSIEPGDLVIVKDIPANEIKIDDVITFGSNKDNITTHRVKEIINDDSLKFITQGDANNIQDASPVEFRNVLGKVIRVIPNVGTSIKYIQENIIKIILITIIAIFGVAIIRKVIKNRNLNS